MRDLEKSNDTFDTFGDKVAEAIKKYPSPVKLFDGLPKRMQLCIENKGGPINM